MQSSHYLTINEADLTGNVYIIGDVHGTAQLFGEVLRKISSDDILIVAGDLIDRGETEQYAPTSALVLDRLMAQPLLADAPKIYAIRGNHEEDFLAVMAMLKNLAELRVLDERARMPVDMKSLLITFIGNGGGWIFREDTPGGAERLMTFRNYMASGRQDPYVKIALDEIDLIFRQGDPLDLLKPECNAYEAYIQSLPYIIKIDSVDNPVLVAHADLPLSDLELTNKIATGTDLTRSEIMHITGARVREFSATRTADSVMVYCGHNIIDEEGDARPYRALPVRTSTNHINLDGGSYFTHGQLLVNHTQHRVEVVGEVEEHSQALLAFAQDTIQQHITPVHVLSPSSV